ncbi:CD177 antigen-like [Sorex fumeus]|uniref:CD177 antigen-like n=1 Tax=Sorex fumeus TaxID=62283 RepID=UPI0024ACB887|nr:CD177 antigen-like [Sorex fumeus]
MIPTLLLTLLGITLQLQPRVQALVCQSGTYESVVNRSDQFIQWTAGKTYCSESSDACQDTLLFIENGPLVKLVLIKGCTWTPLQEARVTTHKADLSLSFVSYTRVCRDDLCNDLSSTLPLWNRVPSTVPGSVQCPYCLSPRGCLSPPMMTCPVGTSHCYDGVLHLGGEFIAHKLRIQGCQSQAGCNLLNGTQEINSLSLRESCQPSEFLTCHRGALIQHNRILVAWKTDEIEMCNEGRVCQESLLLITTGSSTLILGSKGCAEQKDPLSQKKILVHSRPPGVLFASYSHFCNSSGCNDANSSEILLDSLPGPVPQSPGNVKCPSCVNFTGQCPEEPEVLRCPKSSSHCYQGFLKIIGGELDSEIYVQGCMDQHSTTLLNRTQFIGNLLVIENEIQNKAAPILSLAWCG